ncbi:MAG: hypothetical protein ACKVS8_12895 [Phycisphaerales bacterium]
MNSYTLRTLLCAAATLACAGAAPAPPPAPPAGAAPEINLATIPVPALADRLAALSPDRPELYLELAEDVAAEAALPGGSARTLARHLYVLAFATDRQRSGPRRGELGPSACLGLASLASTDTDRRWLRGVAVELSESRTGTAKTGVPKAKRPPLVADAAALDLANALGLIRAGDGRNAIRLLERPGVAEAIMAFGGVLSADKGQLDPVKNLQDLAGRWSSCRECGNRRFVSRADGKGPSPAVTSPRPRVCPLCSGSPGPRLSDDELLGQLRLESAVLRGVQQSWSAQILADGGRPLRDPDPEEVPASFRIDTSKTMYRNGAWQKP